MNKRALNLAFSLVVIVATVLSSCAAPATQAPAPTQPPAAQATAAPSGFNWKQQQGTKITVYLSETPMAVAIRSHIQEFKDLTGIDVDYLVVAETEYWNKLAIDLSSGAGQFNVFMSGPTLNWGYQSAKQIQPLLRLPINVTA